MFAFLLLTCCAVATVACSGGARVERPVFEGEFLEASADEDLLDAALSFATRRSEMAVMERRELEDGTIEYELITLRDEPGLLTATPTAEGAWRISASVGRFGNEEEESALLARLADRIYRLQRAGQ